MKPEEPFEDYRVRNHGPTGSAVAIGCTVVALSLLLWNMPIPGLRGAYRDMTAPAYGIARLNQNWGLFAPEVSQTSLFVHIELVHADNSVTRLDFPDGEPFIGTYRAYRWSAFEETLYEEPELQDHVLEWAVNQVDDPSSVVRAELIAVESDVSTGTSGPFVATYVRDVVASFEPT